jgi:hypothetical protein
MNTIPFINNLTDVHPDSKIWIYTFSKTLTEFQEQEIAKSLAIFCNNWTAHSKELRAFWNIYDSKILVLGVDEHLNPASGCSIDKSVHFLQDIEQQFNLEVFNRLLFSYINNNQIITLNREDFQTALDEKHIKPNTIVVNTLAKNWGEWNSIGFQALQDSWMKNLFQIH